ncbi:MAG: FxsA family protein [Acidimicrobiales bacterium]|nr:FxsA family protein [Acidimicrobiales bacterium]
MLGVLALLFLVVPIAELYVIVQVAGGIGIPETVLLLIVVSVVGAWLAKWQGIGVLRRMQATVAQGKVPSSEILDGVLVIFAAALMITPGFLSDCLAIALLLPPTRAIVRGTLLRRLRAGGGFVNIISSAGRPGRGWPGGPTGTGPVGRPGVWDVDGWEDPPAAPERPPLGR